MAVTGVRRVWSGRSGSVDEVHNRSYTAVFLVRTNSTLDDAITVGSAQAFGLPAIGDYYSDGQGNSDTSARCRSLSPEQTDDPYTWTVRCDFSSRRPENTTLDPADRPENPLERPAEVAWDFEHYRKPFQEAYLIEGGVQSIIPVPVLNSAGFPFDPPPEDDEYRLVLRVKKNVLSFDPLLALQYQGAVNSDNFWVFEPGQCKIRKLTGNSTYERGVFFYVQDAEIEFKLDGWDVKVLDAGYVALEDVGTAETDLKPVTQVDVYGQPLNDPVLLDGDGLRLEEGEAPVFLTFRPRDRLPFAVLDLL